MKLLITDIDGTLLPFGHTALSPMIVDFFHTLHTQHVLVTCATGKPFHRTVPIAQTLGISLPVICANGALIKDPITQKTLFRQPMAEKIVCDVIQLLQHDPRCQLYMETEEALFFLENPLIPLDAWRHLRPGWNPPIAYSPAHDLKTILKEMPHKIAVSVDPQDLETVEERLRSRFGTSLNIFHPKPDIIDLTPNNTDKGTAARFLATYLGVKSQDIIAIGDEMNDLSLCEIAGQSLVRCYAPQALLDQADLIVENGDSALILAIKKVLALP